MTELEKLEKLLGHWKEHNTEHADTYREWAEKTALLGRKNLSDILTRLYNDAKGMEKLFDEAVESIK